MSRTRLIEPPEPPSHADVHRLRSGLGALHKRYVRRAEVLAGDGEYRQVIRDTRTVWNEEYPRFSVHPGDLSGGAGLPVRLETELEANSRQFHQLAAHRRANPDRVDACDRQMSFLMNDAEEMHASWRWQNMVEDIAQRFWSPEAFPVPGSAIHPATEFVAACLFSDDPRFLDFEALFEIPALRVVSHPELGAFVPVYPGITADDIRQAADQLAREAERAYALDHPIEAIRQLRATGATLQAIADQLGMPKSTVQTILNEDANFLRGYVADHGSAQAAADHLGLPESTVSVIITRH